MAETVWGGGWRAGPPGLRSRRPPRAARVRRGDRRWDRGSITIGCGAVRDALPALDRGHRRGAFQAGWRSPQAAHLALVATMGMRAGPRAGGARSASPRSRPCRRRRGRQERQAGRRAKTLLDAGPAPSARDGAVRGVALQAFAGRRPPPRRVPAPPRINPGRRVLVHRPQRRHRDPGAQAIALAFASLAGAAEVTAGVVRRGYAGFTTAGLGRGAHDRPGRGVTISGRGGRHRGCGGHDRRRVAGFGLALIQSLLKQAIPTLLSGTHGPR